MGFWKNFFGGGSDGDSQTLEATTRAVRSLDIDTAKAAHENWKLRLQLYLDGHSKEDLSAENICFDDRCDLGKWIHGTGKAALGRYPGFTALMGNHKMFHYSASNVVALHQAGKEADARKILDGQFRTFSQAVIADLDILNEVVAARRHG